MKVNQYHVHPINPYKAHAAKLDRQKQNPSVSVQKDQIEISKEAKQLSAMASPKTERAQRIQQLKNEVESGTYEIDAEKIAASLIRYYDKD